MEIYYPYKVLMLIFLIRLSFVPFHEDTRPWEQKSWPNDWEKTGLNALGPILNMCGVRAPTKIRTHKSVRFFFTEVSWNKAGRRILHGIRGIRWDHRVISIKGKSVDIVFRDNLQVAVRPRRKKDG